MWCNGAVEPILQSRFRPVGPLPALASCAVPQPGGAPGQEVVDRHSPSQVDADTYVTPSSFSDASRVRLGNICAAHVPLYTLCAR